MTESKFKRVITAITVGAVLLMFILVSVLVYQLISIKIEKREIDKLNEQIAEYNRMIEEGTSTLDAVSQKWWIERRARELGLIYPDDIVYGNT